MRLCEGRGKGRPASLDGAHGGPQLGGLGFGVFLCLFLAFFFFFKSVQAILGLVAGWQDKVGLCWM